MNEPFGSYVDFIVPVLFGVVWMLLFWRDNRTNGKIRIDTVSAGYLVSGIAVIWLLISGMKARRTDEFLSTQATLLHLLAVGTGVIMMLYGARLRAKVDAGMDEPGGPDVEGTDDPD